MRCRAQCWLFHVPMTGSTESATTGKGGVLVIFEWEEGQIAGQVGVGEEGQILSVVRIPTLLPGEYLSVESRRE